MNNPRKVYTGEVTFPMHTDAAIKLLMLAARADGYSGFHVYTDNYETTVNAFRSTPEHVDVIGVKAEWCKNRWKSYEWTETEVEDMPTNMPMGVSESSTYFNDPNQPKCRHCRCDLEFDWRNCPKCGEEIDWEEFGLSGASPDGAYNDEATECQNSDCMEPLEREWEFCPGCGWHIDWDAWDDEKGEWRC